jgi:hypothetical protein
MRITLATVLDVFESNPNRVFTFESVCAEHCASTEEERRDIGEILETLEFFNLVKVSSMTTNSDPMPVHTFQFSGRIREEKPLVRKQERSIADFAKSLEELKANLAANRDKLRDYISEANAFVEDIDEEIDLLDQCADLMSRYV